MSAQPADATPRDAGPTRLLYAVPEPPPEPRPRPTPPPPVAAPEKAATRPVDRVAVTLLAMPVGGLTAAWIGTWLALGGWALAWLALVVWTAWGFRDD